MKMIKWLSCLVFLILLVAAIISPAATAAVFKGDDTVDIDEPINDDVYIGGGNITIRDDIRGDLMVAGGNVTVKGAVDGDLFVAGGQVRVEGPVSETARIAGGTVIIDDLISHDLLIGGGDVTLGSDCIVGGDLVAGAGNLLLSGVVEDDLLGGVGTADIDGTIGGNVKLTADELTVSDGAKIGGDLAYTSENKADIDDPASIGGKITRKIPKEKRQPSQAVILLNWFRSLIGMILVGLVIAWLFPGSMKSSSEALMGKPGASLGLGLVLLIFTPIAALIVLILTVFVAFPIVIIALLIYGVSIYLAQIYAGTAIGSAILGRLSGQSKRWIGFDAALGIFLLAIVRLIPYVGGITTFLLIVFGLGAMFLACLGRRKPIEETKEEGGPAAGNGEEAPAES